MTGPEAEERGPDAGGRGPEVGETEPGPDEGEPRLMLASASPRRLDILRQLGLEPEQRPADVDEAYLPGESPDEHVERLARLKAETVREGLRGIPGHGLGGGAHTDPTLIVGGDTVVVHEGEVVVKPVDEDDAVRIVLSLSGGAHEVLSGLAVAGAGRTVSGVARTVVRMRAFDEATARAYVATGEPMDKAGGYGIQGRGAALVSGIEGDYYSVVGFPVGLFLDLLERVGWRYAFGSFTPTR